MHDRLAIRRALAVSGSSVSGVAREFGISRAAVRRARDGSVRYWRPARGSCVDGVEDEIRAVLAVFPAMPINHLMRSVGWRRSRSVFAARVKQVRPEFAHLPAVPNVRTGPWNGQEMRGDLVR